MHWISASLCLLHPNYSVFFQLHGLQSSLLHCSSPFNKLPFYMLSSSTAQHYYIPSANSIIIPRGLLIDDPSHHTQYHVKQVGAQCGSFTYTHSNCDLASNAYIGLDLCSCISSYVSFTRHTYFSDTPCSLKHPHWLHLLHHPCPA